MATSRRSFVGEEPSPQRSELLNGRGRLMERLLPVCSRFEEAGCVGAEIAVRQNMEMQPRQTARR